MSGSEGDDVIERLWVRNYDPETRQIIEGLPLRRDWRCLDLGAGSGTMSYWLADRVDEGSVLAVDLDAGRLDEGRAPNLTVLKADLGDEHFEPGEFDLVLARAVLSHLPDPDAALRRAVGWLAPGGWLVTEDFYFMPAADSPTEHGRAVITAYTAAFERGGVDSSFARRLPARLAQLGLSAVDRKVRLLGPGQGQWENELMHARMRYQGGSLVDSGSLSAEHLATFMDTLDKPDCQDVTTLQFSAWGKRPD